MGNLICSFFRYCTFRHKEKFKFSTSTYKFWLALKLTTAYLFEKKFLVYTYSTMWIIVNNYLNEKMENMEQYWLGARDHQIEGITS
jgi:hypothetical protein